MSFKADNSHNARFIKDLKNRISISGIGTTFRLADPFKIDLQTIGDYFLENDKKYLETKAELPSTHLSMARIDHYENYPITYQNPVSKESFVLTWRIVDTTWKGHFKKYSPTPRKIKEDYTFCSQINGLLTLSIKDILKHYYFNNQKDPNLGFSHMNSENLKIYQNILERAVQDVTSFGNTEKIFGMSSWRPLFGIYRVENGLPKWDFTSFLDGLLIISQKNLGDPKLIKGILDIYHYGRIQTKEIKPVYYDPPVPIEQAIREHEDLDQNLVHVVYQELTRPLKPKEKELIGKYHEIVLDLEKNDYIEKEYGYYTKWRSVSIDKSKFMNYPPFAFRKYLVYSWIPEKSIQIIHECLNSKLYYQKRSDLKWIQEKRGKPINQLDSGLNQKFFSIPRRKKCPCKACSPSGSRYDRAIQEGKNRRSVRYDMKEQIDLALDCY